MEYMDDYYRQYAIILAFLTVAVAIPTGMIVASFALSKVGIRPQIPSKIKSSIYECGFEAITGKWNQFNFRYYALAIDFVIFDIEVVFLFPWAASYGFWSIQLGLSFLFSMPLFIGILVLGWGYAWRKGSFDWGKND